MKQHYFHVAQQFLTKPAAVLLAFILCLAPAVSVSAAGGQPMAREPSLNESEKDSLSEALNGVEAQKNVLGKTIPGLEDMDFGHLCAGKPVQTYIYANNVFESGQVMYPITYNDRLIFWAIEDEGKFQITTALVGDINDRLEEGAAFSIVYDRNNAYLYSEDTFTWLTSWADVVEERSALEPDVVILDGELETVSLFEKLEWEYSAAVAREPIYYGCDVTYVPQGESDLCWAATLVCITNYCRGTSLVIDDPAKYYFNTDEYEDYNQGVGDVNVPKVFAHYGMDYTYRDDVPKTSVIGQNIRSDYPVYASWGWGTSEHHATCIYGINVAGGYVHIMDPEIGFTSASAGSNGYSYVGKSSKRLTLVHLICHSW